MVGFNVQELHWRQAVRVVGTTRPLRAMFDLVESPEDYEHLLALEGRTSELAREASGAISALPAKERVVGGGAEVLMRPFVFRSPSRFDDGRFGVLYAGDDLHTGIAETRYHRTRVLADARMAPLAVPMEAYSLTVVAPAHDIRAGARPAPPKEIYDPNSYTASQSLGRDLREAGARALHYSSVRRAGAACVGAFYPRHGSNVQLLAELYYHWDGKKIADVSIVHRP